MLLAITYPPRLAITWPHPVRTFNFRPYKFSREELEEVFFFMEMDQKRFDDVDYIGDCVAKLRIDDPVEFSIVVALIQKTWVGRTEDSRKMDSDSDTDSGLDGYESGEDEFDIEDYLRDKSSTGDRLEALEARKKSRLEAAKAKKCYLHMKLEYHDNSTCTDCQKTVRRHLGASDRNYVLFSRIDTLCVEELEYFIEQARLFGQQLYDMVYNCADATFEKLLNPHDYLALLSKITSETRFLLELVQRLDALAVISLAGFHC